MIAYPMGLPPQDPIQKILLSISATGGVELPGCYDPAATTMWWAGKELQVGEVLGKFIGRNEKTKVLVKLQRKGYGPPPREPTATEKEAQIAMMSYYHRKQEELKQLQQDNDDA